MIIKKAEKKHSWTTVYIVGLSTDFKTSTFHFFIVGYRIHGNVLLCMYGMHLN